MNSKEAIKMLRTIQETVYLGSLKFYEAIDVAIKTLEQPEITYCKDCLFGHFYADIINGVMETWVECRNPDGLNRDVSVDGYCSAAIRREQNETD